MAYISYFRFALEYGSEVTITTSFVTNQDLTPYITAPDTTRTISSLLQKDDPVFWGTVQKSIQLMEQLSPSLTHA